LPRLGAREERERQREKGTKHCEPIASGHC